MKTAYLLLTFFCLVASKTKRGLLRPISDDGAFIQETSEVGYEEGETCAPNCFVHLIYNGYCNEACYNEACSWDNGSCDGMLNYCGSYKCKVPDWNNDDYCDWQCYSEVCQYDNGKCEGVEFCADYCRNDQLLGNGQCNEQCNNEACEYDRGDCA